MKKLWGWIPVFGMIFFGLGKVYCATDWDGNTLVNPAIWRSSVTSTADSFPTITTEPVSLGGVIITSAGVGGAAVGIFDGSNNLILSTISSLTQNPYPYGSGIAVHISSSGLRYTNTGTTPAQITILWQYFNKHDVGR